MIKSIEEAKKVIRGSKCHNCRVGTCLWTQMLLEEKDTIIIDGTVRAIVGRKLAPGVYRLDIVRKGTG